MYQRILVPLDGSKAGESALPYVEELVSKLSPEVKVEITLLQVLLPEKAPIAAGEDGTIPVLHTDEEIEQNKQQAMAYLERVGEVLGSKGAAVMARVAVGDACEEIVKAAEGIPANLIAMSTHGRSGLSRWAFGSVTDKVLRREGKMPIVMVRASKEK